MKRKSILPQFIILILLTLAAAWVAYLNLTVHRESPAEPPMPAAVETEAPQIKEPSPTPEPTPEPEPEPTEPPPPPVKQRNLWYTKTSYDAINEILEQYRYNGAAALGIIRSQLEIIKAVDSEQGAMWENIINYWIYVNTELELNENRLPEGLSDDDSLCIVILGFQLEEDGSMSEELVKRCEVGLACAQQYPNAYVAVTGGGTAAKSDNTEAGVMAEWLVERGIDRSRIIVEDNSKTTGQNAQFTLAIIRDNFPQIRDIAIVSSGYHIAEGSMVFYEETQLNAYKYCIEPLNIVSNAYVDMGFSFFGNVHSQAEYIWQLAEVTY